MRLGGLSGCLSSMQQSQPRPSPSSRCSTATTSAAQQQAGSTCRHAAQALCPWRLGPGIPLRARPSPSQPISLRPGQAARAAGASASAGGEGAFPEWLSTQDRARGAPISPASTTPRASSSEGASSSSSTNGSPAAAGGLPSSNGVVPPSPLAAGAGASTSGGGSDAPGAGALKKGALPLRWKIVVMMAVAFVLCNMDKVNMSVAVIPMAHELGWSALDRGLVSSSFFWGYTATQLPGGYIATKIGGSVVLAAGVALWSFGTLIAPPAAQLGILWLCASRMLVGLGEGVAPSAATTVLARLMPANERARAVSLVWGGLDVGSAVGLLLSGPLIRVFGWPSVFYLFASLGLIWCVFWPLVKGDGNPEDEAAAEGAKAPTAAAAAALNVPWKEIFRSGPVWAVTCAHFCFNWGYYTLLAWLPSYFELALGLNVEKSSVLTLIPYAAMIAMMPLVGPVADRMVENGVPLTRVRKICQGIAFVGPAACMVGCALLTPHAIAATKGAVQTAGAGVLSVASPTIIVLVALMSTAFALSAWARAGLYCNHQDLSPQYAGTLLGITNTAGALPGVLGVTAAGYLLDATNSWALALFYPAAACQLFGAIMYTIFASSERQPWS